MASIKQRSTRQNHLTSKNVVSKPKVGAGQSGIGGASRNLGETSARSFKVYTESKDVNVNARIRKTIPINDPSIMAGPSFQKVVLKIKENGKDKNVSLAKPVSVVPRRALADVSNVKGISSKNVARNSLKPPSTLSTNLGIRSKNVLSRNSIQGNGPGGLKQGESDSQSLNKVGSRYLKAPMDSQKKTATRLNRGTTNGRTTRTSLIPTRKSLPVSKRVGKADIPEGNSGSPKETKREIKVASGKKVVARVSTRLMRNRASDGFLITGRNAVDSRSTLRKPIGPLVKNAAKASNSSRNIYSMQDKGPGKQPMVATTTTTKNDQSTESYLCENFTEESILGHVSYEGDCKPSTSDVITKKVSRRRRSYTSSLIEGPKLLEQCRDDSGQEKFASIDDEGNQLEVADYVDEIYHYYWVTEAQIPNMDNYMLIQTDITPHMRAVLIDWLIEVHFKYDLMQETLYLMISLLDRYLSEIVVKNNELQLVGLTALLLASKYEDYWHPKVKELIALSVESHTRDQMLEMEKLILKQLKFRLNMPTPYVFMLRFLKASQADTKLEHLAFYLVDLCLVEYEALKFKPSLLCASAIYVARCTLKMTPPWTPLLCRHARYDEPRLRDCASMVLQFHKAAPESRLKITYEKYMSANLSRVAAMKPLEILPLI